MSLMLKVLELLEPMTDTDYLAIWRDTGVPYHWTRKLVKGEFKNPGVNRIQFLYEHLTGNKLVIQSKA